MAKEIEITINTDGTVEIDQIGWEGKACEGDINDLIKLIGKESKKTHKREWYKKQKVNIHQHRTG
jgi:hypothetical protein